jgi:hypothetical protein
MSQQYRQAPTYNQPISVGNSTHPSWYRFFQALQSGTPPQAESPITVTASPFTYTASQGGFVIVHAGTVSQIAFSRTSGTSYITGQTTGTFPVSAGDSVIVTYSGAPTITFVPQ